jgi:hypothetical protein
VPLSAFKTSQDYHFREGQEGAGLIAIADYDSDGRLDAARVLESDDHRHCAAFITYFPNGRAMHLKRDELDSSCTSGQAESLFVSVQPVDGEKIETWCGKAMECHRGDPKSIKLKGPGIDIGVYEVGYSLNYWDDSSRMWHEVSISE